MRKQYTAILISSLLAFGQTIASEEEMNKYKVPKAVLQAFEKAYPNAEEVEFEEEKNDAKVVYEVEFKESGREYEVLFDSNGQILQTEEALDVKALPEPIIQAIFKEYPEAIIEDAEKITSSSNESSIYEINIITKGKKLELEMDFNGKILGVDQD